MSETLNRAVAFLDAAVADLDTATRPVPDPSVLASRRDQAAPDVPTTTTARPRPAA